MKKVIFLLFAAMSFLPGRSQSFIQVFDNVLYFDGYAARVDSPAPPPGVIRLRNDLYTRRLTDAEIQSIGTELKMRVTVTAACDNYDRIGNVNMALVSKDSTTYNPSQVRRIEIGRYITPFMNKNVPPTSVPYEFQIDNVAQLLKDTGITNHFAVWIELELFGVPYAANTQVAGCAGRKDVFYGSLQFVNNASAPVEGNNVLIPLSMKKNFNNYQQWATDTVGKTIRKLSFDLTQNLTDASFYLVISNHGANSGGEEYNRRFHYVYVDDSLKLFFRPGRASCEPFRGYNTQSNGIYGSAPKTDAQWQSFSNWCPGDVIDIRRINVGPMTAGTHSFKIEVPDAIFTGAQGNFPLSVYLHGKTSGTIDPPAPVDTSVNVSPGSVKAYPNPVNASNGGFLFVEAKSALTMRLADHLGRVVYKKDRPADRTKILTSGFAPGIYQLQVFFSSGKVSKKILISR